MSFTQDGDGVNNLGRNESLKVNIKKLQLDFLDYYKNQFILDVSFGFTKHGILRISGCIRTYVYCIHGDQAQTRSRILDTTTTCCSSGRKTV